MAGHGNRGHYKQMTWAPRFSQGRRGQAGSYRAFIPDDVADFDPQLSAATAELVGRAERSVSELNANKPKLMPLEGLARQLLRSEALASSRIEGLELSHRKLAQADLEGQGEHRALEVLANMKAMERAVELGSEARDLTVEDISAIHRQLAIAPPLDRIAGQMREEPGWIGGSSPLTADFIPSPWEEIPRLMDDLCAFMNRDDLPAAVQAAIAHAQFEVIHPFGDGNGRVGRCLIHVLLRRRGLATRYVPPVSLVLGADKDRYIAGLREFAAGQVEAWCAEFATALQTAADLAERFSDRVTRLQEGWLEAAAEPRAKSAARVIIEEAPTFPFLTAKTVQQLASCSDVAALRALNRLEAAGVLFRHDSRRRGASWEAKELFTLLNEFEDEVLAVRY